MFSRFKESVINSINPSPIIGQSVSIPSSLPRSRSSPLSSSNNNQTAVSNNQTVVSNNQTVVSSGEEAGRRRLYTYTRPRFLILRSSDEVQVTADHSIRPIIVPRVKDSSLPFNAGYAECINGGKSVRNEDQACVYTDSLTVTGDIESKVRGFITPDPFLPSLGQPMVTRNERRNPLPGRSQSMTFGPINGSSLDGSSLDGSSLDGSSLDGIEGNGLVSSHGDDQDGIRKRTATGIEGDLREGEKDGPSEATKIPWTYFGLFDGHAGPGVAVASSATLHSIIQSKTWKYFPPSASSPWPRIGFFPWPRIGFFPWPKIGFFSWWVWFNQWIRFHDHHQFRSSEFL